MFNRIYVGEGTRCAGGNTAWRILAEIDYVQKSWAADLLDMLYLDDEETGLEGPKPWAIMRMTVVLIYIKMSMEMCCNRAIP